MLTIKSSGALSIVKSVPPWLQAIVSRNAGIRNTFVADTPDFFPQKTATST
jgi:hypothetical protein